MVSTFVPVVVTSLVACVALMPAGDQTPARHQVMPVSEGVAPCASNELSPGVVFCDDFEDARFRGRWNIGAHFNRWPATGFVECTNGDFGYQSACAAWSNHLAFDREWGFSGYDARHTFEPQSEFYIRWYQFISNPYAWGALEDKSVLLHDQRETTLMAYVGTNRDQRPAEAASGPGMPFVANAQDLDYPETGNRFTRVNRFQNTAHPITLRPGRWYLFEWYIRLNTPGRSDGLTRLWIDDASAPIGQQTLRLSYADMRWLRTTDAGQRFGMLRLTVYHQRCDKSPNTCPPGGPDLLTQSQRWDRIVVSTAPVGPLRAAGGPER